MGDRTDCPNGCGYEVSATWRNLDGSWDGPLDQRPYVVPRRGDFHLNYSCPGTFESGGAVVFGLLGMAEAIRDRDWFCPTCNNMTSGELYCWVCNEYRGSPDRSKADE